MSKKINLLNTEVEQSNEEQRMNSIFLTIEDKPIKAIIVGCAFRMRPFEKGPNLTLDLKLSIDEEHVKITNIPRFSKLAWADATNLLLKHKTVITKCYPEGIQANLKDFGWITTKNIPVIIKPNHFNGRTYVGRITEIPLNLLASNGQEIVVHGEEVLA